MDSEPILIGSKGLEARPEVGERLQRIRPVLRAQTHKYVVLNAKTKRLNETIDLLQGVKSTPLTPLYKIEWAAVHSVITEQDFREKINRIKVAGTQRISVIPIDKMME